jgi:hypothetical protein
MDEKLVKELVKAEKRVAFWIGALVGLLIGMALCVGLFFYQASLV